MNKYDAPDRSVDEIRLGTNLADVAPVPEPSTLTLLAVGLASGCCGFIRRRSTRSACAVWSNRAR